MKRFDWDPEKNYRLLAERDISFENIVARIANGGLLDIVAHHNRERYPNQRILVVEVDGYAWLVPFVESSDVYFLKTVIPSRKATRQYLEPSDEQS